MKHYLLSVLMITALLAIVGAGTSIGLPDGTTPLVSVAQVKPAI